MKAFRDLIRPSRQSTALEGEAVAEVWEVAAEWRARRLPLAEARRVTTAPQRHLAARFTPPDDPAFADLMALLDALNALQGGWVFTRQGWFRRDELVPPPPNVAAGPRREPFHVGPPRANAWWRDGGDDADVGEETP